MQEKENGLKTKDTQSHIRDWHLYTSKKCRDANLVYILRLVLGSIMKYNNPLGHNFQFPYRFEVFDLNFLSSYARHNDEFCQDADCQAPGN